MLAIISAIENDFEREFITNIYTNYYSRMYKRAYSILGNEVDAEEVVQEAFVKLIEHVELLMHFNPKKVVVYSMVTVKNLSFKRLDKNKRDDSYTVSQNDSDFEKWVSDENDLPEDLYIHREELKQLAATFPKLPEKDRFILEGKYILGMDDKELSEELHISPSSVRTYLTRARRQALKLMIKQPEEGN